MRPILDRNVMTKCKKQFQYAVASAKTRLSLCLLPFDNFERIVDAAVRAEANFGYDLLVRSRPYNPNACNKAQWYVARATAEHKVLVRC